MYTPSFPFTCVFAVWEGGRAVFWDSLFTVLAVYKKTLPRNSVHKRCWILDSVVFNCKAEQLYVVPPPFQKLSPSCLLFLLWNSAVELLVWILKNPEQVLPVNQPLRNPPQPWRMGFCMSGRRWQISAAVSRWARYSVPGRESLDSMELGAHLRCLTVTFSCYLASSFGFLLAWSEISV